MFFSLPSKPWLTLNLFIFKFLKIQINLIQNHLENITYAEG